MSDNINTAEEQKNRKYYEWLRGCMVHDPENFAKLKIPCILRAVLSFKGYMQPTTKDSLSELEKALNDNFPIDFTDDDGLTLLHWAADFAAINQLVGLISDGADINKKDKHGYTPFGIVCWNYVSFGNPKGLKKGLNWVYVPPDYNTEDSCVIKDLIFYNIEDEDCRFTDVDTQSDVRWKKFKWVDPDAQKRRDELKKYIMLLKRKKTEGKKKREELKEQLKKQRESEADSDFNTFAR